MSIPAGEFLVVAAGIAVHCRAGRNGAAVRVFVLGGTGVIGSAVVRELVRPGHEVCGLADWRITPSLASGTTSGRNRRRVWKSRCTNWLFAGFYSGGCKGR